MKKRRFFAGFAAAAIAASVMASVPVSAATTYDGIITGTTAKNSALTESVTYTDSTDTSQTINSYNATELKKVLVIEDDANIPAVSFNYTASVGTAIAATTTTHEVLAGLNPSSIKWALEATKENASANDTFDVDNVGVHSSTGTAGATYTLSYAAQDVHDATGGKITGATDTYTAAAGSDNVLLNNTSTAVDGSASTGVYYAIKTMRLDFTDCGFTEPGIYRYVITEDNTAQNGITYDSTLTRTIDVYVEDATYTPYTSGTAGTTVNKLRIAGYVMYNGTITTAPAKPGTASTGTASTLEDGLANTMTGDNGAVYGTPNGYEVGSATKSEGFKNTYVTHDLTFSKTVDGNQASRDKFFKFKVEIKNATVGNLFDVDITGAENAVPATASLNSATQASYASQVNASQLVADATKTVATDGYTFELNSGSTTVGTITAYYYLQHGDTITIKGLSDNTSYAITESQEDYTAALALTGDTKNGDETTGTIISALTVDTNGDTAADWTAGYVDTALKADATAAFTNTREGTIPTGVILSIAAPAVVGLGVLSLIITLNVKKKREEAEE